MDTAKPKRRRHKNAKPKKNEEQLDYYEILEVDPEASRMRIREAYIRLKNTYASSSQALYSLMTEEEARSYSLQIDEAYRILNDDLLRKEYDDKMVSQERFQYYSHEKGMEKDPFLSGEELVAKIGDHLLNAGNEELGQQIQELGFQGHSGDALQIKERRMAAKPKNSVKRMATLACDEDMVQQANEIIAAGDPGDGALLKEIRELMEVSRDELQQMTKISPEYVIAIENNAFHKLPSLVYVKGFLKSYLQYLGLQDKKKLVKGFTERFENWQREQGT